MDSVDSALRYLQRQFASVANEESEWNEERLQLQQKVRDLEAQRAIQEDAYKDAMLRIKMLEFALRQERGRYLVSPAPVNSVIDVNTTSAKPKAEIARTVTVSRTMERSKSAHSQYSPSPSPAGSPKGAVSHQIFRTDSSNAGPSKTPQTPKSTQSTKGMEITRPRMGSRQAASMEAAVAANDQASKSAKPAPIQLASKGSFRPHKLKVKLSGHMDGVRSLAFHPTEPLLVSGSEDCTVRVWSLANIVNGPPSQRTTEIDSMVTVRAHAQSVLAVAVISAENYPNNSAHRAGAFVTSGRDGSVCLFNLPMSETEKGEPISYEEYQGLKCHMVNHAHDDCVWDLHTHPLSNVLFSAGADGVVRTWAVTSGDAHDIVVSLELSLKSELRCTSKSHAKALGHNYRGTLIPTSVHTLLADSKTCMVGFTSGALAQYDFHGEQLIQMARANDIDSQGRDSQVNRVIAHPTMPVAIAAHQDRKIRMYDFRAGDCVATITAHQDAVSSLSIDSSGLYLASGGHDGSLRIWSVAERHCVFEQAAHRPKMGEAVHSVAYHPSRNFIATGGADSIIKIFQ